MKAKELIYNLRTNLEGVNSQLKQASDQHIMFMLDEQRATLAARKMDKRDSVNLMAQYFDVKPKDAPKAELGTVGTTKVIKIDVPQPVEYKNGQAIFTVGATDGQDSYTQITYSQLRTTLHRKYTGSTPKWLWHNNAIFIINSEIDGLSKVRVRGIFSEPYKVIQAKGEYKYLTPFDWEYPIGMKEMDTIYKLAASGDMGWGDTAIQAVAKEQARNQENN